MWLLVLDHLRRLQWQLLGAIALVALIWLGALQDGFHPHWAVGASMLIACVTGPMSIPLQFRIREFGVLPVSSVDVWRARGFEATVIAAAVTATGKSVTLAVAPFFWPGLPLLPELLVCSTLADMSLLGLTLGWIAVLGRRRNARTSQVLDVVPIIAIISTPFLGFAIRNYLPVDFEGLRHVWWALAPGVVAFFLVHRYFPRALRPATVIVARPSESKETKPFPKPRRISASSHLVRIVMGKAMLPVFMGFGFVVLDVFTDRNDRGLIGWTFLALIVAAGDWRSRLRQLRLLPLSLSTIVTMILAGSAVTWLGITGIASGWQALNPESRIHPPAAAWLLPLVGVSAAVDALSLRYGWAGRMGLILTGAIATLAVERFLRPWVSVHPTLALTAFGGASLFAAATVAYYSLTRSSEPYRTAKTGLLFGVEAPQTH